MDICPVLSPVINCVRYFTTSHISGKTCRLKPPSVRGCMNLFFYPLTFQWPENLVQWWVILSGRKKHKKGSYSNRSNQTEVTVSKTCIRVWYRKLSTKVGLPKKFNDRQLQLGKSQKQHNWRAAIVNLSSQTTSAVVQITSLRTVARSRPYVTATVCIWKGTSNKMAWMLESAWMCDSQTESIYL